MKKKTRIDQTAPPREQLSATDRADNEKSLGSSNAFDATENPQKDAEREWSDEELDDMIDEKNRE